MPMSVMTRTDAESCAERIIVIHTCDEMRRVMNKAMTTRYSDALSRGARAVLTGKSMDKSLG